MTNTKEKLKNYFLQVSNGDIKFAEEMGKQLHLYIKSEVPKSGSGLVTLFGSDLERVALKTSADLKKYFLTEDLKVFEMEILIRKGQISSIVCVDAPRKHSFQIV